MYYIHIRHCLIFTHKSLKDFWFNIQLILLVEYYNQCIFVINILVMHIISNIYTRAIQTSDIVLKVTSDRNTTNVVSSLLAS